MVTLEIKFHEFQEGKPLWKHNNSLLQAIEYATAIKDKITDIKAQHALPVYNLENINSIPNDQIQFTINDQLFLETLLMELRGKSISYSSYKKKENEKREKELIRDIEDLEQKLSQNIMIHLEKLKEDLNIIRKNKMQSILIRSRAQVVEDNEKPTIFFYNLEKHNYASKIIPKIEKEDGLIIKDQYEILNEVKLFYENLYSDKDIALTDINLNHLLSECKTKKLIQEEADKLEGVITYEKATFTLKLCPIIVALGQMVLEQNFLSFFWRNLGHFIVRFLNYGYQIGELSVTQKEGIITCIPKDNKPCQFLKKL